MGAAGGCQVRSEAVTVPGWIPLTCGNVQQQRSCRVVRSVRIEGVRGSNPLSSTQKEQVSGNIATLRGSQLSAWCMADAKRRGYG